MSVKPLHFILFLILVVNVLFFNANAQKIYKKTVVIGQTYNLGKLDYRIDRIKFKKFIGGVLTLKRAHGEFLILSITIVNKSKRQIIMDDEYFKLADNTGAVYEYSPDATIALALTDFPGVPFFGMTVNPNITKTGKIIFEVPSKGNKYALLLVDENLKQQMTLLLN